MAPAEPDTSQRSSKNLFRCQGKEATSMLFSDDRNEPAPADPRFVIEIFDTVLTSPKISSPLSTFLKLEILTSKLEFFFLGVRVNSRCLLIHVFWVLEQECRKTELIWVFACKRRFDSGFRASVHFLCVKLISQVQGSDNNHHEVKSSVSEATRPHSLCFHFCSGRCMDRTRVLTAVVFVQLTSAWQQNGEPAMGRARTGCVSPKWLLEAWKCWTEYDMGNQFRCVSLDKHNSVPGRQLLVIFPQSMILLLPIFCSCVCLWSTDEHNIWSAGCTEKDCPHSTAKVAVPFPGFTHLGKHTSVLWP